MQPAVVIGPTHPERGGVVAHTAELVHRWRATGRRTQLLTWERAYPAALHPARARGAARDLPDVPVVPDARALLRWDRPWAWRGVGREAARTGSAVVLVHVMAAQAPALLALARGVRAEDRAVPLILLAHNVLPHERHPGDRRLCSALLRAVDHVVVHTDQNAGTATALGARNVHLASLPPHLPVSPPRPRGPRPLGLRVLFFGAVRGYKGVDTLLEATARVPEVRLTVAGEHWGRSGAALRARLAADPPLRDRVVLLDRYVEADAVGRLFADHDVVALPYVSGSGSQNADLAFSHGLPVVASRIPTFAGRVRDGVDGLLVAPGAVQPLAEALRALTDPRLLDRLTARVVAPDPQDAWAEYVRVLDACVPGTRPWAALPE